MPRAWLVGRRTKKESLPCSRGDVRQTRSPNNTPRNRPGGLLCAASTVVLLVTNTPVPLPGPRAAATLVDNNDLDVCHRHKAVLSLDQLLHHQFFRKSLPNLERLDLRAADAEYQRYVIPISDTLITGALFPLKELKYYSQGNWWSDRDVRSRTRTRAKIGFGQNVLDPPPSPKMDFGCS